MGFFTQNGKILTLGILTKTGKSYLKRQKTERKIN